MPYLRFASVTLYPSNEDLSLAIGAILRSFSYPSASLVCAKAECEYTQCFARLRLCMPSIQRLVRNPVHMEHTPMDTPLTLWL